MIEISAEITWQREAGVKFTDGRYSRAHLWRFDGGIEVPASASPHIVPLPFSKAENVDPEEAFVAALSSCHMLTFLDIARRKGFVIESYRDTASGVMEKNAAGKLVVSRVILNPIVRYEGLGPDRATEEALHHRAHEDCFIANSVQTEIETRLP